MINLLLKAIPWLSILGGIGTELYTIHALITGAVVVESRYGGRSVYQAAVHPGPFHGFVAFYGLCGIVFIMLGIYWKRGGRG